MMHQEYQYLNLLETVLKKGRVRSNTRNGKTRAIFGPQLEFDLSEGFPLITTRNVPFKSTVAELIWFLSGSTNNTDLNTLGSKIWDIWAVDQKYIDENDIDPKFLGDLGPIYGKMWRSWPCADGSTVDQISTMIEKFKKTPESRRLVVSAWNPEFLPHEHLSPKENVTFGRQALAPCHTLFQFYCEELTLEERNQVYRTTIMAQPEDSKSRWGMISLDGMGIPRYSLSLKLYARSQDLPIGTVFNIASYALLVSMIAAQVNMIPGRYIHTMGDAHIYANQAEIVPAQLKRTPFPFPKLVLNKTVASIFDYTVNDVTLVNYQAHGGIAYPISE